MTTIFDVLTTNQVNDAYVALRDSATALSNAKKTRAAKKHEIDIKVAELQRRGEIEGKAEADRERCARGLFPEAFAELDQADEAIVACDLNVQLAKYEIERIETILKMYSTLTYKVTQIQGAARRKTQGKAS